jgi:hypothetical protein
MEPTQNEQGGMQNAPTEVVSVEKNNANLVIVVVLAVIVVVLALMYLWGSAQSDLPPAPPALEEVVVIPLSDEVDVLEQELVVPEIDTLDAELDTMEAELDAELQAL